MNLIEWKKEFEIGIPGVDFEHEELIKSLNSIFLLIDTNDITKETIINRLGDIYGSISAHFALEERVMINNNYKFHSEHEQEHEKLLEEICKITDEVEDEIGLDKAKLKQLLNAWFLNHFKEHDAKLHIIAKLNHENVSKSILQSMINKAKKVFLDRGYY